MANKKEAPAPLYVEHKVSEHQQRFNWDCGVTCVLMLLAPEQQRELLGSFDKICAEEGFNQSTWTIDLCYLLKRFDIKHHMYTTMPGVNENYRKQGYYNRIIDMDRTRVRHRFATAAQEGIQVTAHALTTDELVRHVCTRGPAIVLVDAGLLVCNLCKKNKLMAEFRRVFGGDYKGHYICVVGVSGGALLYRDPARARRCAAAPAALAHARAATGTDRDVILVYKDFR